MGYFHTKPNRNLPKKTGHNLLKPEYYISLKRTTLVPQSKNAKFAKQRAKNYVEYDLIRINDCINWLLQNVGLLHTH